MKDLFAQIKLKRALKLRATDGIPIKIIDGLYLGSIGASSQSEVLQKHGITHILSVAKGMQ